MARVLVVDDAAFMRKVLSDALASGGHQVVGEAGNGAEAVASYQQLRPELTTLDITMPEKDGLTALAEIMAIDPAAISANPAVITKLVACPVDATAPVIPAASANGTVSPSAIPMTTSRTVSVAVKCCSS